MEVVDRPVVAADLEPGRRSTGLRQIGIDLHHGAVPALARPVPLGNWVMPGDVRFCATLVDPPEAS